MENQVLKYIESIIIEEYKLIQSLEFDFENPDTPDYPGIDPFCKNLFLRGENAIKELKKYLLDVAGRNVTKPIFDSKKHQNDDFFQGYYTKLSLLTIAYETLGKAMTNETPRFTEIATNNIADLTIFLSQLELLYNGYKSLIALKDIRSRIVYTEPKRVEEYSKKRRPLWARYESKSAQTITEYCLVLGFVAVMAIFAMVRLGSFVSWAFGSIHMHP